MSITLINPYENTTAFGGVATGSIKAKEDAVAMENIRYTGSRPMDTD